MKNDKTILYFHNDSESLDNGSVIQSYNLVKELKSRGYRIIVEKNTSFLPKLERYHTFFEIVRFIRISNYIFYIIDGTPTNWEFFTILAKCMNRKIITVWFINASYKEYKYMPWYNKNDYLWRIVLRKISSLFVNKAITISSSVDQQIKKELFIKNSIVIPNGVDFDHFTKVKKNHKKKYNEKFTIMWVGVGKYSWHALDTIFQAAKILEKDLSIQFIFITKDLWNDYPKLNNCIVLKNVTYKKLPEFLHMADVCLALYHKLPTLEFYFSSIKLLEYMAMSKAIIATDNEIIREIIQDGYNGILIKNNPSQLISSIKKLQNDRSYMKQLGKQAKKDIQNYTWNNMADKIDNYINYE